MRRATSSAEEHFHALQKRAFPNTLIGTRLLTDALLFLHSSFSYGFVRGLLVMIQAGILALLSISCSACSVSWPAVAVSSACQQHVASKTGLCVGPSVVCLELGLSVLISVLRFM